MHEPSAYPKKVQPSIHPVKEKTVLAVVVCDNMDGKSKNKDARPLR